MTLTEALIDLIRHKPAGEEDLAQAALFSLDAVACAYAGSATPVGAILRDWAARAPLDQRRRAMLMGALTHITETDDLHRQSVTHPGCVVVPAALALARQLGSSPRDLLEAVLQGFEAMCRVGAAVGPAHYRVWHNTATCGPFGSAMAAARLLGLDPAQTRDALGNAGTQAGGFWEFMATGAMSKHLHAGRAAEAGLLAAELAASGLTGSPRILEGERGFFAAMCDDPQPERLLAAPDAAWQLRLTSIKPWPSCRHTHPVIDCALEIQALLDGDAVESVEIGTYQAALDVCDNPTPETEYQAKFSLYHCAAIALLDGEVGLGSFDERARQRTAGLCAATRVSVEEPYRSNYPDSWGAGLRVRTASGQSFRLSRRDCKGDPELALSAHEMRAKAEGLLAFAGLDAKTAGRVCDAILGLPEAPRMPDIFDDFLAFLDLPIQARHGC